MNKHLCYNVVGRYTMSSKKRKMKKLKQKVKDVKRLARSLSRRDGAYDGRYRSKRFEDRKKKNKKYACRKWKRKQEE